MDKHELTTMTINVDRACQQALLDVATRRNRNRYDGGKWTLDMVVREAIWEYMRLIDQMEDGLNP
jgi:hypothetical protein